MAQDKCEEYFKETTPEDQVEQTDTEEYYDYDSQMEKINVAGEFHVQLNILGILNVLTFYCSLVINTKEVTFSCVVYRKTLNYCINKQPLQYTLVNRYIQNIP